MENKHECKCKENNMYKDLREFMQEMREGMRILMSCIQTVEMDIYSREQGKENPERMKLLAIKADSEIISEYGKKYLFNQTENKEHLKEVEALVKLLNDLF